MRPVTLKTIAEAPDEIRLPIQEFWPESEWDNAASISYLESGWRWDAKNDTVTPDHPCGSPIGTFAGVVVAAERSIGYFQINTCNYPTWDPGAMYNARQNAGTAHALWYDRGWSPWYFSAKRLGLL